MNRRLGQTVVTLTAVLLSGVSAAELNYDYLELRFVDSEIDAGTNDIDGDGIKIGGSYKIADNVHTFGSYQTLDFNGIDLNAFEIGAGYMKSVAADTDFVARLAYINGEIETGAGDVDDSGFSISAGFRRMLRADIEGRAFINHVNLDESGGDTSLELAGDYFFNDQLAGGLSLEFGDDATTWSLGLRYFFGAPRR
jgi:hypothetical protein